MRRAAVLIVLTLTVFLATVANSNVTSQNYVTTGKKALYSHNILTARAQFAAAVAADANDQEANFYYAVTRILAVYEAGQGTSTAALDSVKEILTKSGYTFPYGFGLYASEGPLEPLSGYPSTTPRSGEILNFIKTKLLPEIDGALVNLGRITDSFSSVLSPAAYNHPTGANLNIDYADVLMVRAAVNGMKCALELLLVYDLDCYLPSLNSDASDLLIFRQILGANPKLGTVKEAARLTAAREAFIRMIDSHSEGITKIKQRPPELADKHMFVLDVPVGETEIMDWTTTEADSMVAMFAELKASLSGPTEWRNIWPDTAASERTIDLSKLFDAGNPVNLRATIRDENGDFGWMDPTFGGIAKYGMNMNSARIPLLAGLNLISFPVIPADRSFSSALSSIDGQYLAIWGWDPTSGWQTYRPTGSDNTLTQVEANKGYWIYMTSPAMLGIRGTYAPRKYALQPGWNLVGYNDFLQDTEQSYRDPATALSKTPGIKIVWGLGGPTDTDYKGYSSVYEIPADQRMDSFTSGRGYWIYAGGPTVFAPPPFAANEPTGYELWAGTYTDGPSPDPKKVILNPSLYGLRLIGKALVSDSDYTAKVFTLNHSYLYVVLKAVNPIGPVVKIDAVESDGACFYNYVDTEFTSNMWGLWNYPCSGDGQYAELEDGGGVFGWVEGVDQLTVYGIR